jgi:hypothetical protein
MARIIPKPTQGKLPKIVAPLALALHALKGTGEGWR